MRPTKPRGSKTGFTLLEVVIALAVFTFAIIGLIGMVPSTIVSHRQAISNTVIAQITQQLSGEAQMCGPDEFANYTNQTWYFDYQGNQLSSSTNSVYRASTVVTNVYLPGQTSSSGSLQLVQIYAAFDPTPNGTKLSNLRSQGIPSGVIVVNQPAALAGGL